ncbi:MAG: hypothetical protein IPL79_01740 [Myxococcales bacterium]|nr:hypothetical protein [Myxococcales bacterium]
MAIGRLVRGVLVGLVLTAGLPARHASAQGDWDVQRDPFDKTIVARLKATLAKQPHDATALARLTTLYRKHRTLAQLASEYEKLAQASSDGAALVVLGKLARAAGDDEKALIHFEAAQPRRATDVALLLEIADALRRQGKSAASMAAYQRVLAPSLERKSSDAVRAYDGIAAVALATGDVVEAAAALKEKLALMPSTDTMLEYADLLARGGKHGEAAKVFGDAEARLKADPMKRLEVIGRAAGALATRGDDLAAIAEYQRAIKLAPAGYYLANEYWLAIVEIYRRRQELPQLATELEARWPSAKQTFFKPKRWRACMSNLGNPKKHSLAIAVPWPRHRGSSRRNAAMSRC